MTLTDAVSWRGQRFKHTWLPDGLPTGVPVLQVSGLCWTTEGQLLLVSEDRMTWQLPGGHPEPGEQREQTLVREVLEEACAQVTRCRLLGAQYVEPEGHPPYVQARFVAWVRLLPFRPRHETVERLATSPGEFLKALEWGPSPISAELLRLAMAARDLTHNRIPLRQRD